MTVKEEHQRGTPGAPLGIWVTLSPHAESGASNETGGAKWASAPLHHQGWSLK